MAFIQDVPNTQDIQLTSTIKVEELEGRAAKVTIPEELRVTEKLLGLINQSLAAQGLSLQHMDIAEVHKEDLKGLPNVVMEEKDQ